ncbi:hypothetical protein Rumeso_01374 [Rubellimicrobium mesophilum DSM 19309]|uniref:Uncharacterized protein n=1 Tax=Rubellimicrobium mesophilum DSM 19309 TaxID=442562 RepID=A0A017HS23_9RHOB|nr:hypothetical protein [Rubellimicrobium mesophilum]EYD77115.1 hypothetical protein Rumeso_01374 [Rubellimicrobium mesophilum DSM 19309]
MDQDPLFLWRLAPDLTIEDAAILIAGGDPSAMDPGPDLDGEYVKRTFRHPGFTPAFSALKAAIRKGQLKAKLCYSLERLSVHEVEHWRGPNCWIVSSGDLGRVLEVLDDDPFADVKATTNPLGGKDCARILREPDWSRSVVDVEDLKAWMELRGFTTGFFFPPREGSTDDFLDEAHDHFAPELALAVSAWRALANKRTFIGGVKAVIKEWIASHPGAWKGEGTLSDNAKDRVATVINWKQEGGAPKTGA